MAYEPTLRRSFTSGQPTGRTPSGGTLSQWIKKKYPMASPLDFMPQGGGGGRFGHYAKYQPASMITPRASSRAQPSMITPRAPGRKTSPTPGRRTSRTIQQAPQMPLGQVSFWQAPQKRAWTGHPHRKPSDWEARYGGIPGKPTMGELPEYETPEYDMPEYDVGRVSELQELAMGTPMGRLRKGLQRTLREARYSDNPMVRAMQRREALAGYGEGIAGIRGMAGAEAMSLYAPEYQARQRKSEAEYRGRLEKGATEYQARVGKIQQQFQTDLAEYLRAGRQITTPLMTGRRLKYKMPRIRG